MKDPYTEGIILSLGNIQVPFQFWFQGKKASDVRIPPQNGHLMSIFPTHPWLDFY